MKTSYKCKARKSLSVLLFIFGLFTKEIWIEHFTNLSVCKQVFVFMRLQYKSFENTMGKEEIARNEQILLFP